MSLPIQAAVEPAQVLAYDELPPGSTMTLLRGVDADGEPFAQIDLPSEPMMQMLRRFVRQPLFWAIVIVIVVWNNLWLVWQFYHPRRFAGMLADHAPAIVMQIIAPLVGLLIGSAMQRKWVRLLRMRVSRRGIWLFDASRETPGENPRFPAEKILNLRNNGAAIVL